VAQRQHSDTLLRLAWDSDITGFHGSSTLRGDLVLTGGDHSNLPLGFNGLIFAWGTSPVCWDDQQEEMRGSSCG